MYILPLSFNTCFLSLGVRIFADKDLPPGCTKAEAKKAIEEDLKGILTGLAVHLFGDVEMRWREDYFPFTEPSFELDIFFNNDWMEVLGCGVIHDEVMANANQPPGTATFPIPLLSNILDRNLLFDTRLSSLTLQNLQSSTYCHLERCGWAFGLGLERLAMVLFSIPDIRLFWTDDERFTSQFQAGQIKKFQSYSKYPLCYKDVSFWLPDSGLHPNDVYELIRNEAGDLVERVELIDQVSISLYLNPNKILNLLSIF